MAWDDVLVAHVSKYTAAIHNEMVTQIKARILHSLDTEANGVLVGTGAGAFIFKTITQFKTILGLGDAAYKNTGITTGTLAAGDDSRLSNDRNPTAHKSTHATGGTDALSASDIGAESANANIQSHISSTSNPHSVTLAQVGGAAASHTHAESDITNLTSDLSGKEPTITKNTAFNKNYDATATNIKMDGVQSLGELDTIPRADHVHPTDTSRIATADIDTDSTFAANSDSKVPSQKAVKTAALNWVPRLRTFFTPTYLYSSSGVEKPIYSATGMHTQNSAANGDYLIIPVFCAGGETLIDLMYAKSPTRAIFDLYISNDGTNYTLDSSGYDGYTSTSSNVFASITTTQTIVAGWNFIKLVANGKNASSTNYGISVYGVRLR